MTMEGTRPILAEVQALVTPTMFGNAKRTTTGLDFNRASLIMAVLEKRAGLLLAKSGCLSQICWWCQIG